MERSATQVLLNHLPDAIFQHEDGFYAQVYRIVGDRAGNLNRRVLLDELAHELERWRPDQIGIPDPRANPDEYQMIEPREVIWDVFPLTFECTNPGCGRVRRWFRQEQVVADTDAAAHLRCAVCNSKMRQLRYVTAHMCGAMEPLHTPRCPACQRTENMYLDDVGSFRSSSWRCRACGAAVNTRFTPCGCGNYANGSGPPYRQGYTTRDKRVWFPQILTIVNLSGQTYENLQQHDLRGVAALASWLGDEPRVSVALSDLDLPVGGSRLSPSEWTDQEARLRSAGIADEIIAELRRQQGPATAGIAAVRAEASDEVVEMATGRGFVERAGLYDRTIITDRISVADLAEDGANESAGRALEEMASLGIEDISVTQRFPIVVASYGYTRSLRTPGTAHLRSYAKPRQYNGQTPIFTVPANAEALLVTLDARAVLGFLADQGDLAAGPPDDPRDAKLALARVLATNPDVGGDDAAGKCRRLVHSASHALLRALDDGQSGFGESSLAEWIVPDALTTGLYVASYTEFTLGAFDTVLRRRVTPWLQNTADGVERCDNDPMCEQTSSARPHAACDRCLHLSFGCRTGNADLDRRLLRQFWLWTRRRYMNERGLAA